MSATEETSTHQVQHARMPAGLYTPVVVIFVSVFLISNIGAVKLIELGPIITDGGALLFPLAYVVGDVLAEVYGLRAARRAIYLGFSMAVLAAITFLLVQIAPPAADWPHQEAFESVLGFVPRIVVASLAGYLVGQLLNAYVLVWLKERTGEGYLWVRLVGSTAVGELADTVVFAFIAFYGIITGVEFFTYAAFGYFYKTLLEVLLLPLTYRVIAFVKSREPSYAT